MTQEERWLAKYNEVRDFIEENHRKPSKLRIEEHDMLNWLKVTAVKLAHFSFCFQKYVRQHGIDMSESK
jgi:hypothetical protein